MYDSHMKIQTMYWLIIADLCIIVSQAQETFVNESANAMKEAG